MPLKESVSRDTARQDREPETWQEAWLSDIRFLVLTLVPWVAMIWLLWPRR
jgi:hypothetical protein